MHAGEAEIVARITTICDEFEAYGYRRVGAELRHQGLVVNGKKIRRLMREHDLQPRRRRRFVATTDSDHERPIFPNLTKDMVVDGPNQLWVGDLTYIAVASGFVYLAALLDAWSRRVIGYAISRSIDARLSLTALKAALRARLPEHRPVRGPPHPADGQNGGLILSGLRGALRSGVNVASRLTATPPRINGTPRVARLRGAGVNVGICDGGGRTQRRGGRLGCSI